MTRAPALVVLALAVVLSGCGGDDGPSAKETYLAEAEKVCSSVNDQIDQAKKERPASTAAIGPYVRRLVDLARDNVDSLSKLTPPPDDAADLEAKVLVPLRDQLKIGDAYVAKVEAAVKAKDPQLLSLISNPPTQTKADVAFMRSYGFQECVTAADTGAASK